MSAECRRLRGPEDTGPECSCSGEACALELPTRRLQECVERWPECESGAYDPRCCRFPKSCSCTSYPSTWTETDLEPAPGSRGRWRGEDDRGSTPAARAASPLPASGSPVASAWLTRLDRARHRIPFWWWLTYDALVGVVIVVGISVSDPAFWLGFGVLAIAVAIDTVEFIVKRPSARARLDADAR